MLLVATIHGHENIDWIKSSFKEIVIANMEPDR
jgi:hypothetical protein